MTGPGRAAPSRAQRGSAAVEYLGLLPLLVLVGLLALQGLATASAASAAEDAARSAASAAATGDDARRAATASLPGWLDDRLRSVVVTRRGGRVTVTVELAVPGPTARLAGDTVVGSASFAAGRG